MSKILKTLVLSLGVAFNANAAETILIETESFKDHGGWVNDSQFMDQMGSPYLLAHRVVPHTPPLS